LFTLKLVIILHKINIEIMKKFALTTKEGEIISTILSNDLDEAIELFSMRKHISSENLLEIFNIKEL